MAKKSTTPKPPKAKKPAVKDGPITLTFDLYELPTSQHKAGLAGLLLQIESMKSRSLTPPEYQYDEAAPTSRVRVTFTEETTAALFDDLYDATWVESRPQKQPRYKGKGEAKTEQTFFRRAPITETMKGGREKVIDGYVYLVVSPTLAALRQYLSKKEAWLRLWQDLIWQVIRDSRKKAPYIQRAKAKTQPKGASLDGGDEAEGAEGKPDKKSKGGDGSSWADLVKHQKAVSKHQKAVSKRTFAVGNLSSALLLGAQDKNAESLAFSGRIDHNLLLHFWPMTTMVFVPRFLDTKGEWHLGHRDKKDKSQHFCLGVPSVADLPEFLKQYPNLLESLRSDMVGYRPKESVIDLPAESGVSFVEHLARLGPQTAGATATRYSVSAIDYLHASKAGNKVLILSTGRVAYNPYLAEDYRKIVGCAGEKTPYGNPLFRRGLMMHLLEGVPWYRPFNKLFAEWDASFFLPTDTPPKLPCFWVDARKKLEEFIMSADSEPMTDKISDERLAAFIERIIKQFLLAKAKKRKNIDPKTKFDSLTLEQKKEVYDEKRKVALDAFYRARARRAPEFVSFFTEEICSFGSYFKPKANEFQPFANALIDPTRTDDIKALTLLTLSANA